MSFLDLLSHRYQLNTIVDGRVSSSHDGMHLLSRPRVGSRLVMYGISNHKRIVTSRVVRVYDHPGVDGTFVETGNSVYLLQLERVAAPSHRMDFATTAELSVGA
ncbi:MAG: hypothetical protein AAF721_03005 [Myxococcota bacterium]